MFARRIALLFVLIAPWGCSQRPVGVPPTPSPELQKALASFEIAEGFDIELVAAEPLVADPVAMEIDEDGNFYVVEMHGYPLDLSRTGKIKLLKDQNGDGYPDTATVFADSLTLPTGICRWQKGVIVTDPPHVLYLEDTNHDGRADIRKPLLSGFALSNPQHNLNTPVFGLDNWIHMAHQWAITPIVCKKEFSDEGQEIYFPDRPQGPRLGKNADDRNVRFRPDRYELEATSGESQFGHTFDNWGHHFFTENAKHLYHEALAAPYIKRNPHLLVPDATAAISDHGDACEVFPITQNPNHQLLTDVGVITSACGVTWYNGGAFPKPFDQNITFVAEPVHNLIHTDVVRDQGASFVASRVLEKKEFLASRDAWFRPVNFYVGPDGALYVVDYYRQIVEHPEWMSKEVNESGALYNGSNKGRIYRIVPKGGLPMDWLGKIGLSAKSDKDLVQLLENPNGWWRRTAQRLLFERKTKEIQALKRIAESAELPEARVHALWLLDGLGQTDAEVLRTNLRHPTPGVRENAIKLTEMQGRRYPELVKILQSMTADTSAKVRYQLLCSLGAFEGTQNAVAELLATDTQDPWVQLAAISASSGREMELFQLAVKQFGTTPTDAQQKFFAYLAGTIANAGQAAPISQLLRLACTSTKGHWQSATLQGLAQLWQHRPPQISLTEIQKQQLLGLFRADQSPQTRRAALDLLAEVGLPTLPDQWASDIKAIALNQQAQDAYRADAIYLLSLSGSSSILDAWPQFIAPQTPLKVQFAAIESVAYSNDKRACSDLLKGWKTLQTPVQDKAIDVFLRQPAWAHLLLDGVAQGVVKTEQIGWRRMVRLMNNDDVHVRDHARKVLAGGGLARETVYASYEPSLRLKGDYENGEKVFERVCATCHQIGSKGVAFGPELNSLRNRPAANLLESILIPNRAIADKYEYWHVAMRNGKSYDGIIASKSTNTLTLRQMGGQEITISKDEVLSLKALESSAMPNGLENAISVKEMADLLAFIRGKSN
jgi:putative membrane-bound dehydrogenase-like protein